ncbi:protein adenylyltransferase SelO [Desulfogranum mediterraneum]|uniref:protein adenylyltransferase SelO n=1 Tax=Desulfogranum mediterraneum TaxID=160661 RepID=UPI0004074667|nr:YdiU family protein [Desulfogranum mediterraneum]
MAAPLKPSVTLDELSFDNSYTRELPGDPLSSNRRRQVSQVCYSRVRPRAVTAPCLLAYSAEAASLLDLGLESCRSPRFTEIFSGNLLLPGMDPHAMCYGGHQFGQWAGQLGDGRAINLGEVINRQGERWALQLKGAGATPYSRTADGLAVLRSSLREFLCSEAMYQLGIPTTRALSLVTTGELVDRDMFYDGNIREEPGAVVCRLAPSFLRFGNFQIHSVRGETAVLGSLADYTLKTFFPHLGTPSPRAYTELFKEICSQTLSMIIHWLRVGFVHGVMNTDNMSILGLTIDYGPYGWLEGYDPTWTPNTTDRHGRRYCFGNQARVALWNLSQLANALYPLIGEVDPLQEILEQSVARMEQQHLHMQAKKLGLRHFDPKEDPELIDALLELLQLTETDMTIFYRKLAELKLEPFLQAGPSSSSATLPPAERYPFYPAYYTPEQIPPGYWQQLELWLRQYARRLAGEGRNHQERRAAMNRVNPKYVLRNYLAQLAIDGAEAGDPCLIAELLQLLRSPYDEQPEQEQYAGKRPEWARHRPGCSMLSCSS